jgi:Polyketide cyclase / dehydrase and lipid transport
MPFIAEAERSLDVSPEVAFDRLANHASWGEWMPASFRPIGRSKGPLRRGDDLRVRIAGMPMAARIRVSVTKRPDPKEGHSVGEITWTGGVPGVLWAEHRFLFEPKDGGTRVRSVETWHGALSGFLKGAIKRKAEQIGGEQLAGLARGVRATT